jgi:hypothetical protein
MNVGGVGFEHGVKRVAGSVAEEADHLGEFGGNWREEGGEGEEDEED